MAHRLSALDTPFTIFSPGLAGVAKSEPLQSDGMLLRALARGDANVILRNILYRLWMKPFEQEKFLADIRLIFPHFDIEVDFNEKIDEFIGVFLKLPGNDRIPIELAGTGLLQAIQILAYIHLYSPNLIVLDEPDSHLHPNNQRAVCALLSEMVVDRGIQVIMTTHSRHVLDATVSDATVYWIQAGKAKPATFEDAVDVLLDMGALDVKESLAADQPEVLVVTEDKIIRPLEIVVSANNKKKKKVSIKSYYGVRAIDNTVALIHAVREFSDAKIVVHRDRDYMPAADVAKWEQDVRAAGAIPFVTSGTDIESYFSGLGHLGAVNPDWTQEDLLACRSDALADRLPAMKEKAINWSVDYERKLRSGNLNVGKIASAVEKTFQGDELLWIRGKELVAGIREQAQKFPDTLTVYQHSEHLQDPELTKALS